MARIALENIRHSYMSNPQTDSDWALKNMSMTWEDGSAYALLGSSGCGKTTLLNIISGLLEPSQGTVTYDSKNVAGMTPVQRNIAQVFQFPVVYDTMTVYGNLAFPLRNRGMSSTKIDTKVREIAAMLDLGDLLKKRAAGLTADEKQKISLGRGLVRSDVNVIMFDEPLTVIDPHLKRQLRSKLKELHQQVGATMIYVTHDQTEALTFADHVVVMQEGEVVQMGTPVELFEKPLHTFVGHFIGSPGMNVLPCNINAGSVIFAGNKIETHHKRLPLKTDGKLELGIRPEFIRFADSGIAVEISKITDIGRFRIVETAHQNHSIKLIVPEGEAIPSDSACIVFAPDKTHLYIDSWLDSAGVD